MRIKQLLGSYDPEKKMFLALSPTLPVQKDECEKANHVWFMGYCFDIEKKNVKEIKMNSEYVGGGKVIYSAYAIMEVE